MSVSFSSFFSLSFLATFQLQAQAAQLKVDLALVVEDPGWICFGAGLCGPGALGTVCVLLLDPVDSAPVLLGGILPPA